MGLRYMGPGNFEIGNTCTPNHTVIKKHPVDALQNPGAPRCGHIISRKNRDTLERLKGHLQKDHTQCFTQAALASLCQHLTAPANTYQHLPAHVHTCQHLPAPANICQLQPAPGSTSSCCQQRAALASTWRPLPAAALTCKHPPFL